MRIHKIIGPPIDIEPNAIYLIRVGKGFDIKVSDSTGSILHGVNSNITVFDSNGEVTGPYKVWVGQVTSKEGKWVADISSANFNTILDVQATAISAAMSKAEDGKYASIYWPNVTTQTVEGLANNATAVGLLVGVVNTYADCGIRVLVIGT